MSMWPLFGGMVGFVASTALPTVGCIDNSPIEDIPFAVLGAMVGLAIGQVDRNFCSTVPPGDAGIIAGQNKRKLRFNVRRLLLVVTVASLVFTIFAGIRQQRETARVSGERRAYHHRRYAIEKLRDDPALYKRLRQEIDDEWRHRAGYIPTYP